METSGEVADLLVKESLQVTEEAVKLAGAGVKNAAALLLALAKSDFKVVGQTTAKKLAKDPVPSVVVQLKKEDIDRFKKLSKNYGVLYCIAQKKGNETGIVSVISTQSYAAQLNAVMENLGYPIPEQAKEESRKKAQSRAPQKDSSSEHGNGLNPYQARNEGKPSTRRRLAALEAASKGDRLKPERAKEIIR